MKEAPQIIPGTGAALLILRHRQQTEQAPPQGDAVRIYNYVRLVRNGSSTGINENKYNHLFNVYPNPVFDELTIEKSGDSEITSLELLNSIGQIVQNGSFTEKIVIQTNNLATGVYLIKLQQGTTFEVKKLIKE